MAVMQDIERVAGEIAALCRPEEIILYNIKVTLEDEIKCFYLCVILDTPDKNAVTRDIFLRVDSPVPFDVLLYTPAEKAALAGDSDTFLHRILRKGRVLYHGAKEA